MTETLEQIALRIDTALTNEGKVATSAAYAIEFAKSAIDGREYQAMWCDYYQLERFAASLIQAGAASRDAEVYTKQGAIDMLNQWNDELLAQIKQKDAEVARLKAIPVRYRRLAFNAQLQDEIAELVAALERMRVAGGSQEFHIAWELAKDVLDKVRKP